MGNITGIGEKIKTEGAHDIPADTVARISRARKRKRKRRRK